MKRSLIPNRIGIEERPKIIEKRQRVGDFEGDTLGKPKHSPETLVAITDRKSRFFIGRKVSALKHSMETDSPPYSPFTDTGQWR